MVSTLWILPHGWILLLFLEFETELGRMHYGLTFFTWYNNFETNLCCCYIISTSFSYIIIWIYENIYLSNILLMAFLSFPFCTLWIRLTINILVDIRFISLGKIVKIKLLNHWSDACWTFWNQSSFLKSSTYIWPQSSSSWFIILCSHQQHINIQMASNLCQNLVMSEFFNFFWTILRFMNWYLTLLLLSISLATTVIEHIVM